MVIKLRLLKVKYIKIVKNRDEILQKNYAQTYIINENNDEFQHKDLDLTRVDN